MKLSNKRAIVSFTKNGNNYYRRGKYSVITLNKRKLLLLDSKENMGV